MEEQLPAVAETNAGCHCLMFYGIFSLMTATADNCGIKAGEMKGEEEAVIEKVFNVSGSCMPERHYMVDIEERLKHIKRMVEKGDYFTINRARQYGKTTILKALGRYLKDEYTVISLDFQKLSRRDFETEESFVQAVAREILKKTALKKEMPDKIREGLCGLLGRKDSSIGLAELFGCFGSWRKEAEKPVVLAIDEIDNAANNQVFLDFLSQLRSGYIDRDEEAAFWSVILAGVYDIKNLKRKFVGEQEHKMNSPWNIAADFLVDMSFSEEDIAGMLRCYEEDRKTGMDIMAMSKLIFSYTSGYPFLVSRICKTVDERIAGSGEYTGRGQAWTKAGILEAVKLLLTEKNTLFESLSGKLLEYPELKASIYSLLFNGNVIPYNPLSESIDMAEMFGLIKKYQGNAVVSNRIFETLLYNYFLGEEIMGSGIYKAALWDKNQYIQNGHLNMELILRKFVQHFEELYGGLEEGFLEEAGWRYFLLYLKPIINGVGNYYIEARTRNMERTDVIVDYRGEQFVVELKIWRGNAYKERGERQLSDYLDYYHLRKGYMLSFNFNKNKLPGVKEIRLGDKVLVEAVV